APQPRAGEAGEEHLGVDAVGVLLAQALLGRAGAGRGLVALADRPPAVASLAAVQVVRHFAQRAPFDQPGIAAVGETNDPRHPLAVLGRDSRRPVPGIDL